MGPGEAISIVAAFVLVIVAMAMVFAIYSKRLQFKQRKLEIEAGARGEGSSAAVERLEQRVRVLERIATERGHDVAHQIEALRDRPHLAAGARQGETN